MVTVTHQAVDVEQRKVRSRILVGESYFVRRAVLENGVDRAHALEHPLVF